VKIRPALDYFHDIPEVNYAGGFIRPT